MKKFTVTIAIVLVTLALCIGSVLKGQAELKKQEEAKAAKEAANKAAIQAYINEVEEMIEGYSEFSYEYEFVPGWHELFECPTCDLSIKITGGRNPNYGNLFDLIDRVESIRGNEYGVNTSVDFYFNGNKCYVTEEYLLHINGEDVYNAIASKNGVDLTNSEKKSVCKWIERRYNYYDSKEGGYAGDKYSDKIFKEASDYFNIRPQDLDIIWMNYYSY